ncbi:NUDIX domain-containing protein [Hoyosella subflava]|uniref:MutT-like domain protein n=1 Tax=Hoyosella subflava (strain DSM 45089 / JCM 17490 / NBRC 109087 / DQS3-9A1) TaxID=443218 RepID=F6EJW6_HOYSD|nr:NUDIX domain-containing protein [Hoyosella subflava]AEF41324.1 MutT-like domain protein [Hoyosella subflava DQS3-9A1]
MAESAGILLYRMSSSLEVFLAHMGGPFWARRTEGAWTIPKGECMPGEDALATAHREFAEEIGSAAPDVAYFKLGSFRYASGKVVHVFAGEAALFEVDAVSSNTFELEWPPRSGRRRAFPEIDDARWVPVAEARPLLVAGQRPMLDALAATVREPPGEATRAE